MTLDDIRKMIIEDIDMDKTELDVEAIKTPQLHNKYLNILTDEKILLASYSDSYKVLRKKKWLYYTGKMSEDELKDEGWEPFPLNLLKQDIDKFLDSDEDLILSRRKIKYQEEKVNYLEGIIKMIINRQWLIREAIDWIKFTNGT